MTLTSAAVHHSFTIYGERHISKFQPISGAPCTYIHGSVGNS